MTPVSPLLILAIFLGTAFTSIVKVQGRETTFEQSLPPTVDKITKIYHEIKGNFAVDIPKNRAVGRSGFDMEQYLRQSYLIYHVLAKIRGSTYNLILDTGSSDSWIIQRDFECIASYSRSRLISPTTITEDLL